MPFGSFFKKAFKKTASDVAAQYGGENARGLVEQGIDQIPFGDDDPNNPAAAGRGSGPGLGGLGGDDLVSGLLGAFSGQQQNALTGLFGALGGSTSGVEQRAADKGLDPALINGVISMLTSGGGAGGSGAAGGAGGGGFDLGALLSTVASLTKGGGGGAAGAGGSIDGFLSLLSGGGGADGGVANSSNIIQILIGLAKSFFAMQMGKNPALKAWGDAGARSNADDGNFNNWAMHLIKDLIFPGKKEKDVIDSNPDDKPTGGKGKIKGWFDNHPEIGKMQKDIFDDIFDTTGGDKKPAPADDPAPIIPQPKDFEPECSVLDNASILFLNTNVLLELRKEWRFLYSSKSHPRDFGDFVSRIELQGPSVLVVQDGDGNIFGAFASTSWADTSGAWTGNGDSFVFSIKPKMAIFHATGKDDNIMFLSRDAELGLGGRKGRFGLSLASSLEAGTYHEDVDTFDLPPIFAEEFSVAHVEVWGLGPATNASAERAKLQLRKQNMDITNRRPVDIDDLEGQIG